MKKTITTQIFCASLLSVLFLLAACQTSTTGQVVKEESIKIGFIGGMSGGAAKYGSFEAVQLAVEEINAKGGINGRSIELIAEDGKCDALSAVNAAQKLINYDHVEIILGGHCTTESLAIAPIVEENNVVMLASITTTPSLSDSGEYVFRNSAPSVVQSELLAKFLTQKMGSKKVAILFEQSDYTKPIAEKMQSEFTAQGGEVVVFEALDQGQTDMRTVLVKVQARGADTLYLSTINPDTILHLLKQAKELGLEVQISGNDQIGNQAVIDHIPELLEGAVFASPRFDETQPKSAEFFSAFEQRFGMTVPYGIFTAESYDGVYMIAYCVEQYGERAYQVQECLSEMTDFQGASGSISINEHHDGVREYELKTIQSGKSKLI